MSVILICPACKNEVSVCQNEAGFYAGCHAPGCNIFIETGICKTAEEVERIWPWREK